MSDQKFTDTHHEDKTSKWVAAIVIGLVFIAAVVGLSWNESNKIEKTIGKRQTVIDSLNHEIEWRQEILTEYDSLQTLANTPQELRKLPSETRQTIRETLDKTMPKLSATKHNIEVLQKLLNEEQQTMANLENKAVYALFH